MHLHLIANEATLMPHLKQYKGKRNQLKHFLSLAATRSASHDPESGVDSALSMLHELHSQALIYLYHYWTKMNLELN